MLNRSVLFAMANRLHYRTGLSRSSALSHAWRLARGQEPEYTKARGVTYAERQQASSTVIFTQKPIHLLAHPYGCKNCLHKPSRRIGESW